MSRDYVVVCPPVRADHGAHAMHGFPHHGLALADAQEIEQAFGFGVGE
jgi:hypothetical protein